MQLLRITSIPMKYSLSSEPARLEYTNDRGAHTMEKTGGTFDIRAQNIKVQMDSTEFRNGLGYMSREYVLNDFVSRSQRAGREAVQRNVDFGNDVIHIEKGASIPDILYSRMMQDKTSANLTFVPLSPIQMNWTGPELDVKYTPVSLSFDWRSAQSTMEYIPGKFSMDIQQYPEIKIEYLGRPVYVPPRADPEYQGTA